jgi:TrpR family trp operon transcriptional repressor
MSEFDEFIDLVHKTKDKDLLQDFLLEITTPGERHTLARRIVIVRRIVNGEPHQQIAKDLGVGVSTVTRGSKELNQGHFKILRKNHHEPK